MTLPNGVQEKMNKIKLLRELIASSPVKIFFCGLDKKGGDYDIQDGYIRVDSSYNTLDEQIVVLIHELKHAKDGLANKPYMYSLNRTMCEYYALSKMLQKTYQLKDKTLIKIAIGIIKWNVEQFERDFCISAAHYKAAKKVQKLKTWQKCCELVG